MSSSNRRILVALGSLGLAAVIWMGSLRLFYREDAAPVFDFGKVTPRAASLAHRSVALWTDEEARAHEVAKMRRRNAEWDFMGRSYVAWALANRALRDPATKQESLEVIDRILEETLRLEADEGFRFFLLPYVDRAPYKGPDRSLFVDSEIALMLALRRLVEEKAEYRPLLAARVEAMVAAMRAGPVMSAESYPDECWMFDNANAAAAVFIADALDGTDHSAFLRDWLAAVKAKLVDPQSGILVSSFTHDGETLDGPEGSSIWMVSQALLVVDEPFARDQYARARHALGRTAFGFGWAREWPAGARASEDVDSGVVVPILEASPSSSGLAILAASAFGDEDYLEALLASLALGGFPIEDGEGGVRYAAGNQVGDAVVLYALMLGPAWRDAAERARVRGQEFERGKGEER